MPAASSGSGPPARRSPSSPTTACTRCSTAGRSRPASRRQHGSGSWSTRTWGWSRQVFDERSWLAARPPGVGHCRYSTTGGSTWENAQPTSAATPAALALAHNGNLTNSAELRDLARAELAAERPPCAKDGRWQHHDTALGHGLLADHPDRTSRPRARRAAPAARRVLLRLHGRAHALYAARDPQGIRPLVLGGSSAAGSSPPRRPPSTSSAPPSSARSSPAS
jgi:glutamine phosphoribosylpyrophosphate amidotransferase